MKKIRKIMNLVIIKSLLLACFSGILLFSGFSVYAQYSSVVPGSRNPLGTFNNARAIAADSMGNYYAAFYASYSGYRHIYVRKSTDGGNTWLVWNGSTFTTSGEVPIETSGNYAQYHPAIAIDSSNNVYVVWHGRNSTSPSYDQIRYCKYTTSWSSPVDITSESYDQLYPSIAIDSSNNLHVVWEGKSSSSPLYDQIRYSKYTTSWSSPADITLGNYSQAYPSIAIDSSNNVHVVWHGRSSSSPSYDQIRYCKYTTSWSSPAYITSGNYHQNMSSIAIDSSDNVHVAWQGKSSASPLYEQIRYSKYTTSWSSPADITSGNYYQRYPSIAIDSSDNVHVVWYGTSSSSSSYYQIRYSKYTGSWSASTDMTSGSYSQTFPSIEKSGRGFVWQGTTDSSGVSSSANGLMFYSVNAPGTPTATDIADNGDARDIQVNFNGADDETTITEYRIFVVASTKASSFNAAAASSNANYITEAKTGNSVPHTVILTQTLLDSAGIKIVNGTPYRIFVYAAGANLLSTGSNYITITSPVPNPAPYINRITNADTYLLASNNARAITKDSLGNYYITFSGQYNGYTHVFVRKSEDNGVTWKYWNGTSFGFSGPEVPIESSGNYNQSIPSIAVDSSDNIHVTWQGRVSSSTYEIRYAKYSSGSWSSITNLTSGVYDQTWPSIAVDSSDNLHVVWQGGVSSATTQIRYAKYSGGSWSSITNLTSGSRDQGTPSIAVDTTNNIHVIWFGGVSSATTQIRYAKYSGGSWSSIINLTSGSYYQYCPSIAVDTTNNIHVIWYGGVSSATTQIRYAKYSAGFWSSTSDLTSGSYNQCGASIVVDSIDNVHVVWYGGISSATTQIRYMKYTDSWSAITNITSGSHNKLYPSLALDASGFVWKGTTDKKGLSSSDKGLMFSLTTPPLKPGTPTAVDIADNGDGRDIQVTFNGASDETNVSGYRIFVLASNYTGTFDVTAAGSNTNYLTEAKTGNGVLHTVTLTQSMLDSAGIKIVNGMPYKIFVLALGQNGYNNVLSDGSNYLTLTSPVPNPVPYINRIANADTYDFTSGRTIAKDSLGNYYLTYHGSYNGYTHIFVRKSEDNGVTWKYWNGSSFNLSGPEEPIESSGNYDQYYPSIAVDSSNTVHVVWEGYSSSSPSSWQIRYAKYSGGSWSSISNLTSGSYFQCWPSIAVDSSDNLHVVWSGQVSSSIYQIRYAKYSGSSWSSITNLTSGSYDQYSPFIAVDSSNNLHVIWAGGVSSSTQQIRYVKYSGGSWSSITNLTSSGYYQWNASIAIDSSNNLHVVWCGGVSSSTAQIRYAKYSGGSWSSITNLTSSSYSQSIPSIAIDSINNLHVVWRGGVSSAILQIRYVKYTDSWSAITNITSGSYDQKDPCLASGASGFIWMGTTDNNGVSSSDKGLMIYVFPSAPVTGIPTAADAASYGDGRDIQVAFNGAVDETNISGYRIFVVPSSQVGSFDVDTASGLSADRYIPEAKNGDGGLHTVTLMQTLQDSTGAAIVNGTAYKVFILSVGQNAYNNSLSAGSADLTLSPDIPDIIGPIVPTASPAGGTYNTVQNVTLTLPADAASTYYTLDGSGPDNTKAAYSGAITVDGMNGQTVTLKAVAYDASNNKGQELTETYTFDKSGPIGGISINSGAAMTNNQTVSLAIYANDLNGTAEMMIANTSDFAGASWEAYAVTKAWTLIGGNGTKTVYIKFKDSLGNEGNVYNDNILFDQDAVMGTITVNTGSIYTNTTTVTLDVYADSTNGVNQMIISNTSGFSSSVWEAYTEQKNWTLEEGEGTKTVYIQFKDSIGLESEVYSDTIILDTTPPIGSVVIDNDDAVTNSTTVTLSVYTQDTNNVTDMMVSNTDSFTGATWETFNNVKPWNLENGDGIKTVYVKFRDTVGNQSSTYSDNIILDTTEPTGTIAINNGDIYTENQTVTLSIYAERIESVAVNVYESIYGSLNTEITHMMISNIVGFSMADWESYDTTKQWTLSNVDGTKTVYIRFIDSLGNISETYSDSIILDTAVPVGSIEINGDAEIAKSTSATLNIYAGDANGTGQMMISNYPDFNGAGWEEYRTTKSWNLTGGNGTKTVYIKFRDILGKESEVYSDTITLDLPPPPDTEGPITPRANPKSGTYNKAQSVTITKAQDAVSTYYTLDGTQPDKTDTKYAGPITVDGDDGQTITLMAVSYDSAGNRGDVLIERYTFDKKGPAAPVIDIPGGTYNTAQTVTLTPASDAVSTYYTTDGTEPDNTKAPYTGKIEIKGEPGATITLKAVSYDAIGNIGEIITENYAFEEEKKELPPSVGNPPEEQAIEEDPPEQDPPPTASGGNTNGGIPANGGNTGRSNNTNNAVNTETTSINTINADTGITAGQQNTSTITKHNNRPDILIPYSIKNENRMEENQQVDAEREEKAQTETTVQTAVMVVVGTAAVGTAAAGAIAFGTGALGGAAGAGAGTVAGTAAGGVAGTTAASVAAGFANLFGALRSLLLWPRRIIRHRWKIYKSFRRAMRLKRGVSLINSINIDELTQKEIINLKKSRLSYIQIGFDIHENMDRAGIDRINEVVENILKEKMSVSITLDIGKAVLEEIEQGTKSNGALAEVYENVAKSLSRHNPGRLFIELPYEPYTVDKYIRAIRRGAPKHTIVLGGMGINALFDMPKIKDRNIICKFNLELENQDKNQSSLRKLIKRIYKWSNKNKVPVLAVIRSSEDVKLLNRLRNILKKYLIGWMISDHLLIKENKVKKAMGIRIIK